MAITATTPLKTKFGDFVINHHTFSGGSCLSITCGDLLSGRPLVRLHSSCLFGESLAASDCDCGQQLGTFLAMLGNSENGVLIYLFQEGRGHGLEQKMRAMALERKMQLDTVAAFKHLGLALDPRDYEIAALALRDVHCAQTIRVATNNPRKLEALKHHGYETVERVELTYPLTSETERYLKSKVVGMSHVVEKLFRAYE